MPLNADAREITDHRMTSEGEGTGEKSGPLRRLDVFFWSGDKGGTGQYRTGLPAAGLRELGHNAVASADLRSVEQYMGKPVEELDAIVGQRLAMPGPTAMWTKLDIPKIAEHDDDLFSISKRNTTPFNFYTPELQANIRKNLRNSDAVFVTNPYLGNVLSEYCPTTFVLPNTVPSLILDLPKAVNEKVTIGWTGGISHDEDFDVCDSQVASFLRKYKDVDLKLGGNNFGARLGRPHCQFADWTEDFTDYYKTFTWDVTFIPLKETHFNRSKSYIKALESFARGIPVVASNVGPYRDFVTHGETGFLVDKKSDWFTYLKLLTEDHGLRADMGAKAKAVAAQHTTEGNAWRYEEAIRKVING